jgi:hypothetical protein
MGSSHRLPNQFPSKSPINRISMATTNRNNIRIVASGVYSWVRLKISTEIYGKTLQSARTISSVTKMTRTS